MVKIQCYKNPGWQEKGESTGKTDANVYKSGRNIPKVNVMEASKASTYNILNSQLLVLQKSAVNELIKPFRNNAEVVN